MRQENFWCKFGNVVAVLAIVFVAAMLATEPATGQTYTVLHAFKNQIHANPFGNLARAPAGELYGVTQSGPRGSGGVVFKLLRNGVLQVLADIPSTPTIGVIRDKAGNLYTNSYSGGGWGEVLEVSPPVTKGGPWTEKVLYAFTGGADGGFPGGALIRDGAGNLYGSTEIGGNLSCIGPAFYAGCGVVFKLDTTGKETVLYSFTSGADGFGPASVILDQSSGIVYGTTRWGGDFTNCQYGCGTVFKLDTAGKKTILYTFTGGTDGAGPGRLIRVAAGDFYGTAAGGGQSGQGVVFKMTPPAIKEGAAWTETVLYSFTGAADGANPWGDPLTRDSAGSFYGVTLRGGDTSCSNRIEGKGCGVVFKLDTSGSLTVLHTFEKVDGTNPEGGLVRDTLGNLYGTAYFGGDLNCEHGYGCGVIFKISP